MKSTNSPGNGPWVPKLFIPSRPTSQQISTKRTPLAEPAAFLLKEIQGARDLLIDLNQRPRTQPHNQKVHSPIQSPRVFHSPNNSLNLKQRRKTFSFMANVTAQTPRTQATLQKEDFSAHPGAPTPDHSSPHAQTARSRIILKEKVPLLSARTGKSLSPRQKNVQQVMDSIKDFYSYRELTRAIMNVNDLNSKIDLVDHILKRRAECEELEYQFRFEKMTPLIERFVKNTSSKRKERLMIDLTGQQSQLGASSNRPTPRSSSNSSFVQSDHTDNKKLVNTPSKIHNMFLNIPDFDAAHKTPKSNLVSRQPSINQKSLTELATNRDINHEPEFSKSSVGTPTVLKDRVKFQIPQPDTPKEPITQLNRKISFPKSSLAFALEAFSTKRAESNSTGQDSPQQKSKFRRKGLSKYDAVLLNQALAQYKEKLKTKPKQYHHYKPPVSNSPVAIAALERDIYRYLSKNQKSALSATILRSSASNPVIGLVEEKAEKKMEETEWRRRTTQPCTTFNKKIESFTKNHSPCHHKSKSSCTHHDHPTLQKVSSQAVLSPGKKYILLKSIR